MPNRLPRCASCSLCFTYREIVRYSDVLEEVKNRKLGLNAPDVASLVSKYLVSEGVRVWR